ncbi:hypothetical protein FOL47_000836 [Perkinsus chesapeaki]|uniref:ATP-dependent DNA helicase n=1 Tax=Perkinsus chesapeaki TaxID=330153 RepID=A0A7J6KUD1_PERCH|nr:hypothetical protein FOL47_000836 [Perkinsus chesapeaki]
MAIEASRSDILPDPICHFSLRPPELLYIDDLRTYTKFFTSKPAKKTDFPVNNRERPTVYDAMIKEDVRESSWIDATGKIIRVQKRYLDRLIAYTQEKANTDERAREVVILLEEAQQRDELHRRLVDSSSKRRVVVFSSALPHHGHKFLVHLLLTLGRFETELDLFDVADLKVSFERAGLVKNAQAVTDREINKMMRRYILEQVLYTPGGSRNFDRDICNAKRCVLELFTASTIVYCATPLVLESAIRAKVASKAKEEIQTYRARVAEALTTTASSLPSAERLISATRHEPYEWRPTVHQAVGQSDESLQAQRGAMEDCVNLIENYEGGRSSYERGLILCGPAGSGKTYIICGAAAFAMSRGLQVAFTSLGAERSAALGGRHIHSLFKIPIRFTNSSSAAESALAKLGSTETGLAVVEAIDVLVFDEIGTIPGDLIDAVDKVLQYVHGSSAPFGGKAILGTGDPLQLPPIRKSSVFTGSMMLTIFRPIMLEGEVRAANCPYLRRVLHIIRKLPPSDEEITECKELIRSNCTFRTEWSEVGSDVLRIFGKKTAEQRAEREFIESEIAGGTAYRRIKAVDEFTVDNGVVWQDATQQMTEALNKRSRFTEELVLLERGLLRFIANDPNKRFYNSQICRLVRLPAGENAEELLTVVVAPSSIRSLPANSSLEEAGWKTMNIRRQMSPVEELWHGTGRRYQYPLRPFISGTIHQTMGDTLRKIASRISTSESDYTLWLKSQVYVLFSRVRKLEDITLVGDMTDNITAIGNLLKRVTQWDLLTEHVLDRLSQSGRRRNESEHRVSVRFHPLVPKDIGVPRTIGGAVYLLVSMRWPSTSYIGQTKDLKRRLREHNRGSHAGSAATALHLRPFGVLAFVIGFDIFAKSKQEQRYARLRVERESITTAQSLYGAATPEERLDVWSVVQRRTENGEHLSLVQCGEIVREPLTEDVTAD